MSRGSQKRLRMFGRLKKNVYFCVSYFCAKSDMKHVILPKSAASVRRRLPFYLAMEEWVAGALPEVEYFFTWRVAHTVIYGH